MHVLATTKVNNRNTDHLESKFTLKILHNFGRHHQANIFQGPLLSVKNVNRTTASHV